MMQFLNLSDGNWSALIVGFGLGVLVMLFLRYRNWHSVVLDAHAEQNQVVENRPPGPAYVSLIVPVLLGVIFIGIAGNFATELFSLPANGMGGVPTIAPVIEDSFPNPDITVKTITLGDTEPFHNNMIFVALNNVSFDEVTYTVGSPGVPVSHIEDGQNGHSFTYRARDGDNFDIRITAIHYHAVLQQVSVEFTVIRLPD